MTMRQRGRRRALRGTALPWNWDRRHKITAGLYGIAGIFWMLFGSSISI